MDTTRVSIRYFYAADFSRWEDLEARGKIGTNQQQLLSAYRQQKSSHPTLSGMTATSINGSVSYAPILSR